MKMISSVRSLTVCVFLNRLPTTGRSPKERNFGNGYALLLLVDSAEHDSAAVFHQNLRLHIFRIDRGAGSCLLSTGVLVDFDIHENRALRSDLRRDFKLQHRLAERY